MKTKQKIIISLFILTIIGAAAYFMWHTETGREYTAKILAKEYIPNQDFDINKTLSVAQKDSVYKDFRAHCPFHFQMSGLAKFADSSYLFIISEPAPYVQMDSVLSCFGKYNIHAEVLTHPVGYDGWVKDIVICVGRATSENIANITKRLNPLLYLSTYKPFTTHLPLDTSRIYYASEKLNYRISLSEINQWFLEDKELFLDLPDTSRTFSIPDIFIKHKTGVFYSQLPGFVIWSLQKRADIAVQKANIRKFALDADLILGAVSDSNTLVIIGRERESGMMELPPLNVETVLLLAAIKDGELSQSLDVNDLLAGKMSNDKDWCPTYLSPQLEHTEFGHLLTVTDVLLKDWSESGTLQYEEYPYPKPPYYPFDRPLFSKLGLNELVYNWNTANTMFVYDYDSISLYALNRTGSLPVSYFNSQAGYITAGHGYENTAYNYFSGLCNTDLIRVVQYTSLYQIFQDNEIVNKGDSIDYAPKNKPYLLFSHVKRLLSNIRDLSDTALDSISRRVGKKNYEKFEHARLVKQINDWERDNNAKLLDTRRQEIINEVSSGSQSSIRSNLAALRSQFKNMDEKSFGNLCRFLSYPRGNQLSQEAKYKLYPTAGRVINTIFSFGKPNLKELGMDLVSVKNYYSASLKNSSSPWMKTPSLIISYNSAQATGGHNISSKIRRVNSINADKAIINSGRPQQATPRYTSDNIPDNTPDYTPSNTGSPSKVKGSSKPKVTASVPNKPPKATAAAPVRKRSEVISASARTKRGF